jgi:hypothetical protein
LAANHRHDRLLLPATRQLLVEGGDARITLAPGQDSNKYGCSPQPDSGLMGFGSATASTISEAAFGAADELRRRLLHDADTHSPAALYARELNRLRQELSRLCGIHDLPGLNIVFAASGTDLHLIAAQIICSDSAGSTLALMLNPEETGSGVPAALAGRHFSGHTAQGESVNAGSPINDTDAIEVVSVPIRQTDGTPRPAIAIDAEIESLASSAIKQGRHVLLILTDVSKTGLIAPSVACVAALQLRWQGKLDILIDACQFRLAPATLRAYLTHDFMVAVTGSKFLTGPTFSGALLIPSVVAQRLRSRPLPRALQAYSAAADWPTGWDSAGILDAHASNFGLLLRWEAALAELRAFQAIPEAVVKRFMHTFADAIQHRLSHDPIFEPISAPLITRHPLIAATSWDHIPTIFPFLLRRPAHSTRTSMLSREETVLIYRQLQDEFNPPDPAISSACAKFRFLLGQPVATGQRNGIPVSALRLCNSARLVIEATTGDKDQGAIVIERALCALDKTALLVRCLPS